MPSVPIRRVHVNLPPLEVKGMLYEFTCSACGATVVVKGTEDWDTNSIELKDVDWSQASNSNPLAELRDMALGECQHAECEITNSWYETE